MDDKKLLSDTFTKLLEDIAPQKLLNNSCDFDGKILRIQNSAYDLRGYNNIYLFGSGKAVLPMAQGMQNILKNKISKTFLVGAYENSMDLKNTIYTQSSHPIPSQKSIDSAIRLQEELESLGEDDFFIYLLSGGTSALIEIPEDGITLQELQKTTDIMLKNALFIEEINCIRKHISKIKGGKLASSIKAKGVVLVLSDVLGDNLQAIGSGPLYFDDTTFDQALFYLKKYHIFEKIPKSVQNFILKGIAKKQKETPKSKHKNIEHFILGSNKTVLKKAQEILNPEIKTTIIQEPLKNEVSIETQRLLDFAKANSDKRACFLFGGECTVRVDRDGMGGRNQHLALNFLSNFDFDFQATLLCGATDGVDGNSSAAGAVVQTEKFSKDQRDEMKKYLKEFNSNLYFKRTKDLLKTDPTHNNLLDITMMIIK